MLRCVLRWERWSCGSGWHDNSAPVSHARIMRPASGPAKRAEMDAAVVFRSAVTDLEAGLDQQRRARPQLAFEKQSPPRRLAPFAAAIGATVHDPDLIGETSLGTGDDADTEIGWGSFVLLYDP